MNKFNNVSIIATVGFLIQVTLCYALFEDWAVVIISSIFSLSILGISILVHIQNNGELKKLNLQHTSDVELLQNEIDRLQSFNKKNLNTIKRLKDYLDNATKKLKERSIDFLNTANNMDVAVVALSSEGKIQWVNYSAEKLYSFDRNFLINEPIDNFLINEDYQSLIEHLDEGDQELELEIQVGSNVVLTRTIVSYLKDRDEKTTGTILTQIDISEMKLSEKTLKVSLDRALDENLELREYLEEQVQSNKRHETVEAELREAVTREQESTEALKSTIRTLEKTHQKLIASERTASVAQVTYGIINQLKDPIHSIEDGMYGVQENLQYLYLIVDLFNKLTNDFNEGLLDEAFTLQNEIDFEKLQEGLNDLMEHITANVSSTNLLIQNLEQYTSTEEQMIEEDLGSLADATVSLYTDKSDSINIKTDITKLLPILCYPEELKQAFNSILTNAIEAVEDIAVKEVSVKTFKDKDHIVFEVSDNGVGIDNETQKRIFEPFFTTKQGGISKGLSLSKSQKIIEKHHGEIDVKSKVNHGTTFKISFPQKIEATVGVES